CAGIGRGAGVHRHGRNVDQPRARRSGGVHRESGPVDVDRDVLIPRSPALHDRGGVHDGAHAARRSLPRRRVGDVARDRLCPEPQHGGATRRPYQRAHRLAARGEGLDHVTADEATRARDEHAHAGAAIGKAKGRSTTRASRPAARTTEPGSTSRRISARPIQRPAPATPVSGTNARLVTRPTSRSTYVTTLQPSAGAAGGSGSNNRPRIWRFTWPRKCSRATVSWPV